jgi:nitrite reductase/ring-hydroxylating ferredoxin subunit
MSKGFFICDLNEIGDPGSRGFSIELNGETCEGFVVQRDGEFHAYCNSCPHTGSPLDWVEHQFLDLDQAFIQCAVHDARFEIATGVCIAGPCPGKSLQKLQVTSDGESLYLEMPHQAL